MRYVRTDGLKAQIEEVQAGLRQGQLYAGHGAGALFPLEEHVALLAIIEKLYQSILAGSENRIEERTHFEDREDDVVLGINRVLRKVREAPSRATTARAIEAPALTETLPTPPSGMSLMPTATSAAAPEEGPADPDIYRRRTFPPTSI